MRLAILSFFSSKIERGVETYVQALTQRLPAEIITSPHPVIPYSGIETMFLRRLYLDKTSRQIYQATKSVLKQLAQNPPAVLYPVNNGWQSILSKWFCWRHPHTKLVLAGHSGPGWDDRINLLCCPDVFIAFSHPQAQWARGVNPKVRVETISHAVDLEQFKPGKSSVKLHLPKPIFVSVSALTRKGGAGETDKNVAATVQAIARLGKGSLLLIGSGPDESNIDQLAQKLLTPNRYQRITASHNIMQRYYQAADVFTLASSTSEAFGLSYLEALACNLPVVTIDDNLRREIIGPAGVFVKDPNSSDQYARGLSQTLTKKWNNLPRLQAEKYSWAKIIKQYQHLLASL